MSELLNLPADQWERMKKLLRQRLESIEIPTDINPPVARSILSQIDLFYQEIRVDLADLEGYKERLDNKIRELERVEAVGANESERKRNAALAVKNYPGIHGEPIDLYEYQRIVNERLTFLRGIVDVLDAKQSRLITISAMLKLERSLMPSDNFLAGFGGFAHGTKTQLG